MPENHVPKKQPQPVYAKSPAIVEEKPVVVEEKKIESQPAYLRQEVQAKEPVVPKQERIITTTPIPINEEPTLNEKYSESLDDIKRRYTETYLSRKQKSKWTSTHTSILQVVGGAVLFCFLVAFLPAFCKTGRKVVPPLQERSPLIRQLRWDSARQHFSLPPKQGHRV